MSSILSGNRTYITLGAGVLATWLVLLLGATCPPADPTAVADTTAAVCKQFAGVQVTFSDAIGITWAALAGAFGRAAIK